MGAVLMDAKIAQFYQDARSSGLLDDTMLIITSDHGEAFGDHELYLHDASVFDSNIRVPLWIHHPDLGPQEIDQIVSQRGLFELMRNVGLDRGFAGTLLDEDVREQNQIVVAEHFYYPNVENMQSRYRVNLISAMTQKTKLIVRGDGIELYDRLTDPSELHSCRGSFADFAQACVRESSHFSHQRSQGFVNFLCQVFILIAQGGFDLIQGDTRADGRLSPHN